MSEITNIKIFSGTNINILDSKYCQEVMTNGTEINFGDVTEEKQATEIMAIIQLYGEAIQDVLDGKTPKRFPWAGEKVKQLQTTFEESSKDIAFEYTYPRLLVSQIGEPEIEPCCMEDDYAEYYNQMDIVRNHLEQYLKDGIISNRIVGNIYNPYFATSRSMPCFNWFQIRMMNDGKVSLRILFRSHDYGSAVWANICAIAYWFKTICLDQLSTSLELSEIIVISTSAHVYDYDQDSVKLGCHQFGDENSVANHFM